MSKVIFDGFIKVIQRETGRGPRVIVKATHSVNLFVFIKDRNELLLTTQVRDAMICNENPTGQIVETIAGRFDVDLTAKALMVKEAEEEAGISITEDEITLLNFGKPLALSSGILTEKAMLGYVEIDSSRMESTERIFGADGEGERISRVYLTADGSLLDVVCEDLRVFAFLQYFLRIKNITQQ